MCFYHDCEYVASINEKTTRLAKRDFTCGECRKLSPASSIRHEVYQQEHDPDEDLNPDDADYKQQLEDFDIGYVFEMAWCDQCEQLRAAIRAVEISEGCSRDSAEPLFGELYEAVEQGEGWQHYRELFEKIKTGEFVPWPTSK